MLIFAFVSSRVRGRGKRRQRCTFTPPSIDLDEHGVEMGKLARLQYAGINAHVRAPHAQEAKQAGSERGGEGALG